MMKKYLTLILSLLIILQCVVFANAVTYDVDSRYTFDLPENYRMVEENKFMATDDNSNFFVSVDANTNSEFCVGDMNDAEVKALANDMAEVLSSVGVGMNIKAISSERITHQNGNEAIVIVLEQTSSDAADTTANYEKIYMFSSEENVITFTYTTDKKDDLDKLDGTFDSIVINEKEAESTVDKIKTVAFYVGVFAVLLAVVIIFVKRHSK